MKTARVIGAGTPGGIGMGMARVLVAQGQGRLRDLAPESLACGHGGLPVFGGGNWPPKARGA